MENKTENNGKIYGSVWFSLMSGELIGIVTMNNGFKDKAYIGLGRSKDKVIDIKHILKRGSPFPFEQAIALTGGK